MKSYYRTKRMLGGVPCGCFTQRFIQDLENMDITSQYTGNVEPSGEGKNKCSPHILIELSTDQFNTLKSITRDVNEKYFEMDGDNKDGYISLSTMVEEIFEKGFEYFVEDLEKEYLKDIENDVKGKQER